MGSIRALLNPLLDRSKLGGSSPVAPQSLTLARNHKSSCQPRKKQKMCKDAAVFTKGPIKGECRYPPHERPDDMLAAQHQRFEIYPIGKISEFPRHIPYNSEKKTFLAKTNRERLEVFQYQFRVPGDDQAYSMLWDYNIGLVRTTPLFKCTGHSKTTPAKILRQNIGLKDICHSITGGALVAQGYWMPYEAAKAVAATFCWKIRYALTPVFGNDFPALCSHPDSERFGDMMIDPAIIKKCAEQAKAYREEEVLNTLHSTPATPSPPTPDTPTHPKRFKSGHHKKFKPSPTSNYTSPYASDTNSDDSYTFASVSPAPVYRNVWTPANTPRSAPHFDRRLPSPRDIIASLQNKSQEKNIDDTRSGSGYSSPSISPKTVPRRLDIDEHYHSDYDYESKKGVADDRNHTKMAYISSDENAACLLLGLKFQRSQFAVAKNLGLNLSSYETGSRKRAASA